MATGWKSSYFRYKELFLNVSAIYKKRADLQAFLEIVLSIVMVIVFLMYAIKPTAQTIISLVQQIKDERQTLEVLTQKVSDLQKAKNLMDQNQNHIGAIDIAVSTLPIPDVFVKQIGGLAAKNSLSLMGASIDNLVLVGATKSVSRSVDVAPLPENANEMGYTISVKGSFASIQSFLKDLENLRIISAIDSVTINSSETESGRTIVAVVSGRVPYLGSSQ